jgi:hypothetical protein
MSTAKRLTEDHKTPTIWPHSTDDDKHSTRRMFGDDSEVQLSDLQSTRPTGLESVYKTSTENMKGGILRQTEFEVHEDIVAQGSDSGCGAFYSTDVSRQHPWMRD